MNSRLSQTQREALELQDARFLALPLQAITDPNPVLAHLRHIARLLKDRQATSPCSRAITHLNALFDRSIPEPARKVPACREGCAHCCRQPVLVYAPELFFLAAHIRGRDGVAEKVLQSAQTVQGRQQGKRDQCFLLESEACTVYSARPLSCHAFTSADVNDCISSFRYANERPILSPPVYNLMRDSCRMILIAALKGAGFPTHAYHLSIEAIAAILTQDNAEKRWLRGEDVLAMLPIIPSILTPEVAAHIDQMAARIAPEL